MTDLEYATMQAKKALEFVRRAPKVNGKLKDRKLAAATGNLLRAFRGKDAKKLLAASAEVFGLAP